MREKECLKELQKGANWAIWCKANPKDKGEQKARHRSEKLVETGRCVSMRGSF